MPTEVVDYETGSTVLANRLDPERLAEAMLQLLEDRPTAHRFGEAARQRADRRIAEEVDHRQLMAELILDQAGQTKDQQRVAARVEEALLGCYPVSVEHPAPEVGQGPLVVSGQRQGLRLVVRRP